jgi:hypothetical protein
VRRPAGRAGGRAGGGLSAGAPRRCDRRRQAAYAPVGLGRDLPGHVPGLLGLGATVVVAWTPVGR